MRLAVLADIHGNVLALEAVLADIARRGGADGIVDHGDCVSGPLWPRETLERLDALGALTVRGNHDRQVATLDPSAMGPSDRVAHAALSPEQRAMTSGAAITSLALPGMAEATTSRAAMKRGLSPTFRRCADGLFRVIV